MTLEILSSNKCEDCLFQLYYENKENSRFHFLAAIYSEALHFNNYRKGKNVLFEDNVAGAHQHNQLLC